VPLKSWVYQRLFASWAGPLDGSLAFAVANVAFFYAVAELLHRRGILLKV
jgi:predicted acyltransferase